MGLTKSQVATGYNHTNMQHWQSLIDNALFGRLKQAIEYLPDEPSSATVLLWKQGLSYELVSCGWNMMVHSPDRKCRQNTPGWSG
jgi:hypothetical protein